MNLDFYCERLGTEFWSEPINALTNFSFIVAGLWGLSKKPQGLTVVLSGLSLLIGIGSFLFHTFATQATQLADLLPIFLFSLIFVYFTFQKVLKLSQILSLFLSLIFVAFMALIEILVPKSVLNGSLLYAPALATLIFVAIFNFSKDPKISKLYSLVAAVFLISLIFRTIDHQVCGVFPLGTHFLWHLFNGLAVALMIQITNHHGHLT